MWLAWVAPAVERGRGSHCCRKSSHESLPANGCTIRRISCNIGLKRTTVNLVRMDYCCGSPLRPPSGFLRRSMDFVFEVHVIAKRWSRRWSIEEEHASHRRVGNAEKGEKLTHDSHIARSSLPQPYSGLPIVQGIRGSRRQVHILQGDHPCQSNNDRAQSLDSIDR
jgi:hypothetical protein